MRGRQNIQHPTSNTQHPMLERFSRYIAGTAVDDVLGLSEAPYPLVGKPRLAHGPASCGVAKWWVVGRFVWFREQACLPPPRLHTPKSGNPVAEAAAYGTSGGRALGEPRLPYQCCTALALGAGASLVAEGAKSNCPHGAADFSPSLEFKHRPSHLCLIDP
jgi:hypothetical protein